MTFLPIAIVALVVAFTALGILLADKVRRRQQPATLSELHALLVRLTERLDALDTRSVDTSERLAGLVERVVEIESDTARAATQVRAQPAGPPSDQSGPRRSKTADDPYRFDQTYGRHATNAGATALLAGTDAAPATPIDNASSVRSIVEEYCTGSLSLSLFLNRLDALQAEWGAIDVNADSLRFEPGRKDQVIGVRLRDPDKLLMMVGDSCTYSMGLALLFDATATSGQRVRSTAPAEGQLRDTGVIEITIRGQLALRT